MRYALSILLLFAQVAGAADEFNVIVPAGSTGVYGIIINPADRLEGYDATTDDGTTYLTLDRTDSDQQIAFSSVTAIAVSSTEETQAASLPSNLSASQEHTMMVFDSATDLLATIKYVPQYSTQTGVHVASMDENVIDGDTIVDDSLAASEFADGFLTNSGIQDGAISAGKLANDAITSAKVAAGAITDSELTATGANLTQLATSAQANATNDRLGAWTGSGRNTILGALQALMRSDADATVPPDINADLGSGAGTASNTTDSTQAVADSAATAASQATTAATNSGTASTAATAAQAAAEAVEGKLPAGGRNMAGAGDTALHLDQVEGGGGGSTTPVLNRKPNAIIRVSNRADGYLTQGPVRVVSPASGASETYLVALAYPNPGDWLFGMDLPVSPDTNQLTVNADAYGLNRNWAMVEVTIANGLAAGTEITLPVVVQPTEGTTDRRKIVFLVIQ